MLAAMTALVDCGLFFFALVRAMLILPLGAHPAETWGMVQSVRWPVPVPEWDQWP
jgi:hypothetical protein